jgi:hypothetical protein
MAYKNRLQRKRLGDYRRKYFVIKHCRIKMYDNNYWIDRVIVQSELRQILINDMVEGDVITIKRIKRPHNFHFEPKAYDSEEYKSKELQEQVGVVKDGGSGE